MFYEKLLVFQVLLKMILVHFMMNHIANPDVIIGWKEKNQTEMFHQSRKVSNMVTLKSKRTCATVFKGSLVNRLEKIFYFRGPQSQ